MRRFAQQARDYCLWSFALSIILVAVLVCVFRVALLQLHEFRQTAESLLSESLGASVHIGSVSGRAASAQFHITDVDVGEGGWQISELLASPNYLKSAMRRTLVWHKLELTDVVLELVQNQQGGWRFKGMQPSGGSSIGLAPIERMLLASETIVLNNAVIEFQFSDGSTGRAQLRELTSEKDSDFHRITLVGWLGHPENDLAWTIELSGTANQILDLHARSYVELSGNHMSAGLQQFSRLLGWFDDPVLGVAEDNTPQGEFSIKWWVTHDPSRGTQTHGDVALAIQGLGVLTDQGATASESIRFQIQGQQTLEGELALQILDLEIERDDLVTRVDAIRLANASERRWKLQLPEFSLNAFSELAAASPRLPASVVDAIAALSPTGSIKDLTLWIDPLDPVSSLRVSGQLHDVSVDAYFHAPSVSGVDGYFESSAFSGYLVLENDAVSPFFAASHRHPFALEQVSGTIGWHIDPTHSSIEVWSSELDAESELGHLVGSFSLRTPLHPGAFYTDLNIVAGLRDGHAEDWASLLPYRVPSSLWQWFESSDIQGVIPEAAFVYRGPINNALAPQRMLAVRLRSGAANTHVLDGWPQIHTEASEVWVANTQLKVRVNDAGFWGLTTQDFSLELDAGKQSWVQLLGEVTGPANDMMDIFRKTGLREQFADAFDELMFTGDARADIDLGLPFKRSIDISELSPNIRVSLDQNRLLVDRFDLQALQGVVHFDAAGLWSDDLQASLWQSTVRADMKTDANSQQLLLSAQLDVDLGTLNEMLSIPEVPQISGVTPVEVSLKFALSDQQERAHYRVHSSLESVGFELPAPLQKREGEPASFLLDIVNYREYREYQAQLTTPLAELDVHWSQQVGVPAIHGVSLGLNRDVLPIVAGQFNASLGLDDLNLDPWFEVLRDWDAMNKSAESTEYARLPDLNFYPFGLEPVIEVRSENLILTDKPLGAVDLQLGVEGTNMMVEVASDLAQGRATLAPNRELILELESLDIAPFVSQSSDVPVDLDAMMGGTEVSHVPPPPSFDPRSLPKTQVEIAALSIEDRPLGRWAFDLTPIDAGVRVEHVSGGWENIHILGSDQQTGLRWTVGANGQHMTEMDLTLSLADVAEVFAYAGVADQITSEFGEMYAHVSWAGSPDQVLSSHPTGILGFDLSEGVFRQQIGGGGNEIMRVVSLVNVSNWARRLQFDFSDVTESGTAYNRLRGDWVFEGTEVTTLTPVVANLPSGRFLFDGSIDLGSNEMDAQLVATLPVRNNLAWVAGVVVSLPAAAGVWVVSQIFGDQLDNLTSVSYRVSGDISDPDISTEGIFTSTIEAD